MNENPFFSVIMPVNNAEKTLNASIGSILTQTYSDYELIIVENGSADKSLGIARAYEAAFPKLRVLHSEPKGIARARNMGLDLARGEYAVFLDADDSYVPNALEAMRDSLEKSGADLLICGIIPFEIPNTGELRALDPKLVHLAMLDPAKHRRSCFCARMRPKLSFR